MSTEAGSPIPRSCDEDSVLDISSITEKYGAIEVSPSADTREIIRKIIKENSLEEEAFYIADFNVLVDQYHKWKTYLPRAVPYYAVKSNPRPVILETLLQLGCGFDCASRDEIQEVLRLGGSADKIIFANPCKLPSHIKFARAKGVKKMTFDNVDELKKIAKYYPEAEMVLRILPDDSHSLMAFGAKFGAHPKVCKELLQLAKDLNVSVIGVSFHVGSGCFDTIAYPNTLRLAQQVFTLGKEIGHDMKFLDIGGGFPGTDHDTISFEEIGAACCPVLDELFPEDEGIQIIGEPGRYFCHNFQTLVVNVMARRKTPENLRTKGEEETILYYINDGVYGAFNCIFFDHAHPFPQLLDERPEGTPEIKSRIFGPTCDSMDLVCKDIYLPELKVSEWLFFPEMGAYTSASSSAFNGFKTCLTYYIHSPQHYS